MSLRPQTVPFVPEDTARVARAAFPKSNVYLQLRDEIGVLFDDADFADLFPTRGQPAYAPWRLVLITIFQFIENLSDRAAINVGQRQLPLPMPKREVFSRGSRQNCWKMEFLKI